MENKITGAKNDKLIRYSTQLAMLGQLLAQGLVDSKEYNLVKSDLMRAYNIISDLTI